MVGPLFISKGSEPNRSVLPLRPLPVVTEVRRLGAAIFGGGATAKGNHIVNKVAIYLNYKCLHIHNGGVMFSSLEKPLLLIVLLLLVISKLLLLVLLLFCSL